MWKKTMRGGETDRYRDKGTQTQRKDCKDKMGEGGQVSKNDAQTTDKDDGSRGSTIILLVENIITL